MRQSFSCSLLTASRRAGPPAAQHASPQHAALTTLTSVKVQFGRAYALLTCKLKRFLYRWELTSSTTLNCIKRRCAEGFKMADLLSREPLLRDTFASQQTAPGEKSRAAPAFFYWWRQRTWYLLQGLTKVNAPVSGGAGAVSHNKLPVQHADCAASSRRKTLHLLGLEILQYCAIGVAVQESLCNISGVRPPVTRASTTQSLQQKATVELANPGPESGWTYKGKPDIPGMLLAKSFKMTFWQVQKVFWVCTTLLPEEPSAVWGTME
ncbi:uncharacterized protein [Syngnathus scovelli]|uniref:uncharacterized protein isoform X3 n=1 Tax=Syngnathus scovelli TaxID=161590 RepID=UPI0035CA36EC